MYLSFVFVKTGQHLSSIPFHFIITVNATLISIA